MKIKIENNFDKDFLLFRKNILYKDDDFYIYKRLIYDEIDIISRKDKFYNNMKDLPNDIKDKLLKEII